MPDDVRAADITALDQRLADARSRAAQRDELADKVAKTEERIEIARHGHSVEDALEAGDRALRALEEQREKDYASVVGAAVADFLEGQVRDVSRPKVFQRARRIFAEITNGRYELDFSEDGDAPEFAAVDRESFTVLIPASLHRRTASMSSLWRS